MQTYRSGRIQHSDTLRYVAVYTKLSAKTTALADNCEACVAICMLRLSRPDAQYVLITDSTYPALHSQNTAMYAPTRSMVV